MEKVEFNLQKNQDLFPAVLSFDEDDENCVIQLEYFGGCIEGSGDDFFEALCIIRNKLQQEGLLACCNGASVDVYPSRMARDMGRGLKAYRLTLGKQATMTDLVSIFQNEPNNQPSTMEAQRQYFENWLKSF